MDVLHKLALSAVVAAALCAPAKGQEYRLEEDIPYTAKTDAYSSGRLKLDIYHPEDVRDAKVVVWFHGGGLVKGNKKVPVQLRKKGIVVVAVNYRLLPEVTIDAPIDDAAEAVAWVFNHISEYGGSPDKVYVAGHSAGGYLTMMIGFDKSYLAKYGIDADRIAALVPYSGQAISHFSYRKMQGIDRLTPVVDKYAPLYHARGDCPKTVLITGDRELEMMGRYEENAYLLRMLKLHGHKDARLYELGGFNHGKMAAPAHTILLNVLKEQ